MIVDSFEIDGTEVEIHIIDNEIENCFSIVSKKRNGDRLNGFEFRVARVSEVTLEVFSQGAPAFAIVSFLRRQIEENHWQIYAVDVGAKNHVGNVDAREAGRKAFLAKQHYRNNPFTELNSFAHDEWDRGWAEEAQKNHGYFDFSIDSFRE